MNNKKKVGVVEGRAVSGQEGFWIEKQVVIVVGIGVMGLGEIEESEIDVIEVRAVSGHEGFWIEGAGIHERLQERRDFLVYVAVRVGGEEWERGDGEGGEEDGRGVGEGRYRSGRLLGG